MRKVRNYAGNYQDKKTYDPDDYNSFWKFTAHDVGFLTGGVFVLCGVAIAEGIRLGKRKVAQSRGETVPPYDPWSSR